MLLPLQTPSRIRLFSLAPVLLLLAACGNGHDGDTRKIGQNAYVDMSAGRLSVCGVVLAGTTGSGVSAAGDGLIEFTTTFVRDDRYQAMEDNDLRGFPDGAFKEGWNQVSQGHLRLGRRARNPAFGEYELFRNLQRWDDLAMPTNASIDRAEIRLSVESGPPYPVDIAVYAVRKDWNPGAGGVNRDNNSPPARGEVWWLDAKFGVTPWAGAGAGYASDSDPRADTYGQPLALARYQPGQTSLSFTSPALARYIETRVRQSNPLLFLYKLTDPYEDSVGSVLEIWSANVGVAGSDRRPQLTLEWHAPRGTAAFRQAIVLEPGRSLVFAGLSGVAGESVAAGFTNEHEYHEDACGQDAFVEFREAGGAWRPLDRPSRLSSDTFDLRVTAATRPVALGGSIDLSLRDTWIPVGAPDEHSVHWTVRRPDGREQHIESSHSGDFTWQLRVPADVPGRWSFRWQHELSGKVTTSEWHAIDVVAREPAGVIASLKDLERAIEAAGAAPRSYAMLPFEVSFMRLERAAAGQLASGSATVTDATEIRRLIRVLRESISGREVPDKFVAEPIKSREEAAEK